MFDGCVLGVDPGVARTGVAVVARRDRRPALVWAATIRTAPGRAESERLRTIHEGLEAAIAAHGPASVAVERLMFGQNRASALSVARATGVILLAAAEAGLVVEEYVPLDVKMAVTGIGNASKTQVRDALVRTHRLEGMPTEPDAVDAVAVALCHLSQARLRAVAARAGAR